MPDFSPDRTLGQIVTDHPDLAAELERRGLDYCCGGARTLGDACGDVGLEVDEVISELASVDAGPAEEWASFGAAALVDHLEQTHHAYLHAELPRLTALAAKVASVHGANHVELITVRETFDDLRADLEPHLAKEEQVLFPMIRELDSATAAPSFHCGSLANPISVMLAEHDRAGVLLAELRHHTEGYTIPADACASYEALYRGLRQLEADTHLHVHKENNRLFPLVRELEARWAPREALR
ncbi:MAG TPA: iron-sulfur cluster repair di-iron protein [Microthrixaceae bacterium]|nr:iron-sulfur cluster repair di-iron protein [Microthrixaceae bacterium]